MRLAEPWMFLWLLPIAALLGLWWRYHQQPSVDYSKTHTLRHLADTQAPLWDLLVKGIRLAIIACIVVALVRPQLVNHHREVNQEGIDIVLALDISGSMRAEDFEPKNRLYVAQRTLKSFVRLRDSDRIGLVVFAGQALTMTPLTSDYGVVIRRLGDVTFDMLDDGTAIGTAVATAINRLSSSKATSKVVILMTDGENNMGSLDPITAAKMAKDYSVKIYTIGVGKEGGAPVPLEDENGKKVYARNRDGSLYVPQLDEGTLKQIAAETGGQYFRAVDEHALKDVVKSIDELEKSAYSTKVFEEVVDTFPTWLSLAFLLLIIEQLVSRWVLRILP